jgi:hypothetical protein
MDLLSRRWRRTVRNLHDRSLSNVRRRKLDEIGMFSQRPFEHEKTTRRLDDQGR